jgi:hypothetical protein
LLHPFGQPLGWIDCWISIFVEQHQNATHFGSPFP